MWCTLISLRSDRRALSTIIPYEYINIGAEQLHSFLSQVHKCTYYYLLYTMWARSTPIIPNCVLNSSKYTLGNILHLKLSYYEFYYTLSFWASNISHNHDRYFRIEFCRKNLTLFFFLFLYALKKETEKNFNLFFYYYYICFEKVIFYILTLFRGWGQ